MLDLLQPRVGGWRLRRLSGKARRDEPERQGHARAIELVAVRASTHGTAASRGLLLRPPGSLGCQPATSLERSAPAIARSAAEGSSSFIRPSWVVREKKFYRTHTRVLRVSMLPGGWVSAGDLVPVSAPGLAIWRTRVGSVDCSAIGNFFSRTTQEGRMNELDPSAADRAMAGAERSSEVAGCQSARVSLSPQPPSRGTSSRHWKCS